MMLHLDAEQTTQKKIKATYITEVGRFFLARGEGAKELEFTRVMYLINVLKLKQIRSWKESKGWGRG